MLHGDRSVEADHLEVVRNPQVTLGRPLHHLRGSQIVGGEDRVDVVGHEVEPFANEAGALTIGCVEVDGQDHRLDTRPLEHLAVALLPQVVGSRARSQQGRAARPPLEQVLGGEPTAGLVVAADIGDDGGEVPIHTDQGQADRAVVGQAVIVGAGDDAIDPVGDEKVEVFAFPIRLAHGVADEGPVAALCEEVFDVLGQLAEEGQGDGGDDQADRMRRLAVQCSGDLIGAVVELRNRLSHPLPCLLGEVTAVVEHAGDCGQ